MKGGEFLRALVAAGCYLKRHGKKHDIYANPRVGKQAPVPRQIDISYVLAYAKTFGRIP